MDSLILHTAIGLVFLFAAFAGLVSIITELISRFIGLRAEYLLRGMRTLLDGGGDFELPWREILGWAGKGPKKLKTDTAVPATAAAAESAAADAEAAAATKAACAAAAPAAVTAYATAANSAATAATDAQAPAAVILLESGGGGVGRFKRSVAARTLDRGGIRRSGDLQWPRPGTTTWPLGPASRIID